MSAIAHRHGLDLTAGVAALLSSWAAASHFAVAGPHFQEWWAYGLFFVAAGAGQALFAVLVFVRPAAWLLLTGIAGNVAIVGMYVLSRTNGPPLGPHAGHAEAATAFDVTCTAAELGVIVASLALLPPILARRTGTVLMLVGSGLWAARLTGVLI